MKLALLVALFIGSANAECPSDFVASISVPGKCHHVSTGQYNFFQAISYCRNLIHGADILAIANGFENNEVAAFLSSRGVGDAFAGNAFYDNKPHWIATAAGNSTYSNWGSGIHNADVAIIDSNGNWISIYSYDAIYHPICQIYPDDPATFPPQISCPSGWTPSVSAYGKCYYHFNCDNFDSAIENCQAIEVGDSHVELITLVSQLEMMEMDVMAPWAWTSLTKLQGDGTWHWVDTRHPTDYFGPDESPTPHGGNCARITSAHLIGDSCSASASTVCQYFPGESSTPPPPTTPSTPTPSPTSFGLNCSQNGISSLTEPKTCYYVLDGTEDFQSARNACQALNVGLNYSDIFVPRTDDEYQEFEGIVVKQISYPLVWLGLTNSNSSWNWVSGRASNVTDFWCSGQPDNALYPDHQCGFVIRTNRYNGHICWIAGDCTSANAVICQSSNTL